MRAADARTLRTFGGATAGWREEITRYASLSSPPYGTPLRRESVVLIVLAVLAYLLRPRRSERSPYDLFATALAVALVLLIATPSKWPWHFGTLIGLVAVAVAAETARLREEARRSPGWSARPLLVVGAATLAAAWSWGGRNAWNDLDLRTLDWTLGIESRLTLSRVAGAAPVAMLLALGLLELARRRRRLTEVPWRAAAWTSPILAVPVIAFTVGVLAADAAKTTSWTVARENVDTLTGDARCGLADEPVVANLSSLRALAPMGSERVPPARGLPPSPGENLPRFTLGPAAGRSTADRSPWFALPEGRRVGFFVGGVLESSDTLELEWGRPAGGRVESLGAARVSADFTADARPTLVPWRFFAAGSLPSPPAGASAMRFVFYSESAPGSVAALTAPATYTNERLVTLLEHPQSTALVLPNLLTYVPCVRQPQLSDGVAQAPGLFLGFRQSIWPLGNGTSPFDLLPELYPLVRLPLTDSLDPPEDVVVYVVDRSIRGAAIAPPTSSTADN